MADPQYDFSGIPDAAAPTPPAPTSPTPNAAQTPAYDFSGVSTVPTIGAVPATAPVTLGDLKDNPRAAMQRIGAILKQDVSDPKLWAGLVASYFAPKLFDAAVPVMGKVGGFTSGAVDFADPDLVSILSPRAGAVLKKAQQVNEYVRQYGTEPPPTPIAVPWQNDDGSWSYKSIDTGEPLAPGTTAHVVTKSGKTFTTTVPTPPDPDVQAVQTHIKAGLSPAVAAAKVAGNSVARFNAIMSKLMNAGTNK